MQFYPLNHPEICGVINCRSIFRCTNREREIRTHYSTDLNRTRPPTTPNPHSLLKCYRRRHFQCHHQEKRSRSMEMQYFHVCDQVKHKQFDVRWHLGQENLGNYTSKHHLHVTTCNYVSYTCIWRNHRYFFQER